MRCGSGGRGERRTAAIHLLKVTPCIETTPLPSTNTAPPACTHRGHTWASELGTQPCEERGWRCGEECGKAKHLGIASGKDGVVHRDDVAV